MNQPSLIPVTREREIRPDGSDGRALAFRGEAEQLRRVAEALRGNIVRLGLSWAGRSSDRFMEWFLPFPYRVDALAEEMDIKAARIDHKTVTIVETVLVPAGGTQPR